jgi:hypothetical protein
MVVLFTKHAEDRIAERGISKFAISHMLQSGSAQVIESDGGKFVYEARLTASKIFRIVCVPFDGGFTVVTCYVKQLDAYQMRKAA